MRRALASAAIALLVCVSLTACLPPNVPNPLDHLPRPRPDDSALVALATQLAALPAVDSTSHSWTRSDDDAVPDTVGLVLTVAAGATPAQQASITEAALRGLSAPDFAGTGVDFELWSGEIATVSFRDYAGTPAQGAGLVAYVAQISALSGAILHSDFAADAPGHVTSAKPVGDASRAILAAFPLVAALPDPAPGNWEWAIPGIVGSSLPSVDLAALLVRLSESIPLAADERTYDAPITVGIETRFGASTLGIRVDDVFTRWPQIVGVIGTATAGVLPSMITVVSWEGTPATLTLVACAHPIVASDADVAFAERLDEAGVVLPDGAVPGLCL